MIDEPIAIDGGSIAGTPAGGDVRAFLGIPYAAPPVGDLRWRLPQPVKPWQSVRNCDRFGPACTQPGTHRDLILPTMGDPPETGLSEDCLYLNVWTAAQTAQEKRPVMVWFHGGGNRLGAGSTSIFWGERLARKGVVVVTFNYRLGALGFLAHPALSAESEHGVSGNYGLHDQLAVLQWVQRNIAAFGGDPTCVTLFGESAGAANISCLIASRLTKGLFHRVIGQSMGRFRGDRDLPLPAEAEAKGVAFGKTQAASNLDELRNCPADQINGLAGRGEVILDGHLLTETVDACFAAGRQNDVPTLVGFNADEGTPYPVPTTLKAFAAHAREHYGDLADEFLAVYPATTDEEAEANAHRAMRDGHFAWQTWSWACAQKRTGSAPVFMGYFAQTPAFPPGARRRKLDIASKTGTYLDPVTKFGAYHGADCVYQFNNLANVDWPWTPADYAVADAMSTYWVTFAKNGDPNTSGMPAWPEFDALDPRVMQFAQTIGLTALVNRRELGFFESYYHAGNAATLST